MRISNGKPPNANVFDPNTTIARTLLKEHVTFTFELGFSKIINSSFISGSPQKVSSGAHRTEPKKGSPDIRRPEKHQSTELKSAVK